MIKIIEELEGLVSSKINEVKTIFTIMKLESRLAMLSILPLLFSVFMILIVLFGLWLNILTLLAFGGFLIFNNWLYALLLVLIVNAGLLYGLFKYLQFNIQNMSFEKTRHYFLIKENKEHVTEKRFNRSRRNDGKKITSSTT